MPTQVQWLAPSPLWNRFAPSADKTTFRAPTLLRFATDTFMQDLQAKLAEDPPGIDRYVAQPESWRFPNAGLPVLTGNSGGTSNISTGSSTSTSSSSSPASSSASSGDAPPSVLKLYQPVHARFYLVAASLACPLPGLPDHTVKRNQGESTTFVVRKLQLKPEATTPSGSPTDLQNYDECAWLPNARTPGWLPLTDPTIYPLSLAPGEEQLPLFNFQFGSNGNQRRMFAGMIPVGKRQTYAAGRALQTQPGVPPVPANVDDPRKIEFQRQVLDPWADLVAWFVKENELHLPLPGSDRMAAAQGSAFILIDFAKYLSTYLPLVWAVVSGASTVSTLSGAQLALYQAFSATMQVLDGSAPVTLAQALLLAFQHQSDFESEVLVPQPPPGLPPSLPPQYPGPILTYDSDIALALLIGRPSDVLPLPQRPIETLIENALREVDAPPAPPIPPPAKDPQNPQGNDWFIVRCVYQRPLCAVRTLPAPVLFSPPSQPFQLASFFDPDAPARRIQVALPVDTTPAALRKYDKGVAFMISDQLNQQMQRVKGLKALMDGDLDNPSGFGLGMICSFSIPIITICAFIVLMIFVILLNIIFFWLPFLKICFPIPTLTSKGSQ